MVQWQFSHEGLHDEKHTADNKVSSLLALVLVSLHTGSLFFPFTYLSFMSFTRLSLVLGFLLEIPWVTLSPRSQSLMEKPQKSTYDPGTGSNCADCWEGQDCLWRGKISTASVFSINLHWSRDMFLHTIICSLSFLNALLWLTIIRPVSVFQNTSETIQDTFQL